MLNKYFLHCKYEKTTTRNKTDKKIENQPGITYCLGSKDFTHNFRPLKVKMANKVPREKSNCVVVGQISQDF